MRKRVLVILSALSIVLLLPSSAGARSDAATAARAEHNRILSYWTAERLASAKHKDYIRNNAGKIVPYARPGGGGGSGAVTGASWTGGTSIKIRSGKLFFSTTAGNWQCSASVVNDGATNNGFGVILTAGHCTYDAAEGWSTNVMYIPDYDDAPTKTCANTIYGCWTSTRLAVNTTFVSEGGFGTEASVAVDYGFMRLGLGGKTNKEVDFVTGGYGLNTNSIANSVEKWAFGYPAAGKYKGLDLTYCKGQTIDDPYGSAAWGMPCNMTGGSSGGPWIYGPGNPGTYDAGQLLTSLNSFGYQGLTYMFGPRFNDQTGNVFGAATSANGTGANATVH